MIVCLPHCLFWLPFMHFEDEETNGFDTKAAEVSDEFKIALANVVINFARLEITFDKLIWWAAHLPNVYTGRAITARLDLRIKCDIALALVQELEGGDPTGGLRGLSTEIAELTKLRNGIVHGWWWQFGDTAVAMSPRGRQEEPGVMMGGKPFKIPDLSKAAIRVREIERLISKIIAAPAPSPRRHEH